MTKTRGFEHISQKQWENDGGDSDVQLINLPERGTSSAAGYDVVSPISFTLEAGDEIKIPTGFKAYMLSDECIFFYPRSGLGFKFYVRLANTVGVGDSDYYNNSGNEGHYWVKMRNEGFKTMSVEAGDRVAQAIFQKYLTIDGDVAEGRRVGGLGSTGN